MKEIKLTKGKVTIVDDEDYEELNKYKWLYNSSGYAARNSYKNEKPTMIHMHRVINNTPVGLETDHIDCDKLNNQKANLRTVTKQQNQFNQRSHKGSSSKYKGVSYFKRDKSWLAQVVYFGKTIGLGLFKKESDAAIAYNNYAKEHFGEFARLNIIET